MMLRINISAETEAKLREYAASAGQELSDCAANLLDQVLRRQSLNEKLAPVRKAFEQSAMTDEQLSELLERDKHAMRAGQ
jgi:hypothetical protein